MAGKLQPAMFGLFMQQMRLRPLRGLPIAFGWLTKRVAELTDDPQRAFGTLAGDPVKSPDNQNGELACMRVFQGALQRLLLLVAVFAAEPRALAHGRRVSSPYWTNTQPALPAGDPSRKAAEWAWWSAPWPSS